MMLLILILIIKSLIITLVKIIITNKIIRNIKNIKKVNRNINRKKYHMFKIKMFVVILCDFFLLY